jgi:hypothetical protein
MAGRSNGLWLRAIGGALAVGAAAVAVVPANPTERTQTAMLASFLDVSMMPSSCQVRSGNAAVLQSVNKAVSRAYFLAVAVCKQHDGPL